MEKPFSPRPAGAWPAATGLTAAQRDVMTRYIEAREAERAHIVVYLSGAHAYGFPSPDSDLDLKAIHVAPTSALVGLRPKDSSASEIVLIDGVEVDYTSNEIGPALLGVLKGNGNYLERFLGDTIVGSSPCLDELAPLVSAALSRRVASHYRGFAQQQRTALEAAPTVKRLLYVLRTLFTGLHALRTGAIVAHLPTLAEAHGIEGVEELVARKRAGENVALDEATRTAWAPRVERLFAELDAAREASALPDAPSAEAEAALERWLVELRRRAF